MTPPNGPVAVGAALGRTIGVFGDDLVAAVPSLLAAMLFLLVAAVIGVIGPRYGARF